MENNTKKVKNIEAVVIIILSILLIGVLVFLGIRYISKQNMSIINNGISNLDDIYNEANNNKEENKNDEIEKLEYSKVSDLIEDLIHEKNPIEKKIDNITYKLDMVLPHFKVKTEVTNQINQDIDKTYKFYSEDYLSKEATQSSSRNTNISYKANIDIEKGILTLEITNAYTDWAGTGAPNGSSTKTYKYDYINDKLIEKKEQENKEEKIDPYANYKNYEWGSTIFKADSSSKEKIEIKNNKVYLTFSNKTVQVKNISGIPIKVTGSVAGGIMYYYILTQQGKETKIYRVEWSDTTATAELLKELSKYNIVDFTSGNGKGVVYRSMYYLTSEGKLIDVYGDTYEELNKDFIDSYGSLGFVVYLDSKHQVYYSKKGDANYVTIKDTSGNKVKAKELYIQDTTDGETIIVITKDSQIIYVSNDGNITQEKGKYKSINTYRQEYEGVMIITMSDNKNIIKYHLSDDYYDVEKKKYIDIKEGSHIESIYMYKRNEKYADKYYPAIMTLTKEQIDSVIDDALSELQYVENNITTEDKDTYKVIIKYKTGIESEIKVYPGSRLTMDGILYSLEGQSIEVFDSIGYKYEWEKIENITNSITIYKRNPETNKYYERTISLSESEMIRINDYIKEIDEPSFSSNNLEKYRLILRYKAGTKSLLLVYEDGIVSFDNAWYKASQLEKYISEIADKFEWQE